MENKYFTPDIEDIRVGYECEIFNYLKGIWMPIILDSDFIIQILDELNHRPYELRVPYLTKEQIEAEGWGKGYGLADFEKTKPILWSAKRIDNITYDLQYNFDTLELILVKGINVVYRSQCKDINTFRYICKLINIK